MSEAFLFWYVFPLVIAVGVFGWLAYDKHFSHKDRMHPGE